MTIGDQHWAIDSRFFGPYVDGLGRSCRDRTKDGYMTRTREQYLEDLLEMFLQLADCFTVEGYGHAVARTKEALRDPTIVRNDIGSPTPMQILRWICERGMAGESKERVEAVVRSLDGLTSEHRGELYGAAEQYLGGGLRKVALGFEFAIAQPSEVEIGPDSGSPKP